MFSWEIYKSQIYLSKIVNDVKNIFMKDFVFICGFNNDEIKIVKYTSLVDELISIMYYHHIVSVLLSSLSTAVVSCAPSSSSSPVPVVCWHGVNDNARRFQFYQF